MAENNLHGTAVVLADRGVLITGRPGAGKTTLALSLVDYARGRGRFARLVADDQLLLYALDERLAVKAPPAIRGLAETYGLGLARFVWEDRAVIDLAVKLVDAAAAPRYQESALEMIAGIHLPSISLAQRNTLGAVVALAARLGL